MTTPPATPDHPRTRRGVLRGILMGIAPRNLAFVLLAGLALTAAGCSSGNKIVGKWKLASMTKDGREEKAPPGSEAAIFEFTADGNLNLLLDTNSLPPEQKAQMEQDKETAEKMKKGMLLGKYTVSGDTIEVSPTGKADGPNLFGKDKEKSKLKFEGDTMTITSEKESVKFSRVK